MQTCLVSCVFQIEVTNQIDTVPFFQALRRKIVNAENKLRKEFWKMDHKEIGYFLLDNGANWIN